MSTVLRQGDIGPEVGEIQQALIEAGYSISSMELAGKIFGPTTIAAVASYQRSHGLSPDGVVGDRTRAALSGAGDANFTAPGWKLDVEDPKVKPVLEKAASYIGTVEAPAASNRGPLIDQWNLAADIPLGSPWCAAFATGMFAFAPGGSPIGRPLGSVLKVHDWAVKNNRIVADAKPGDIGLIVRDVTHGHAVIITADLGGGNLATVEGNSGNAVRGLIRERASFAYIVRPMHDASGDGKAKA